MPTIRYVFLSDLHFGADNSSSPLSSRKKQRPAIYWPLFFVSSTLNYTGLAYAT
jgi:hypothetical protein